MGHEGTALDVDAQRRGHDVRQLGVVTQVIDIRWVILGKRVNWR